jgi:hypothetical protein
VSGTWLSAIGAVVVAIIGALAGSWSNRRALKDELEIANLINEVYPCDTSLQQSLHARVTERVALISMWTSMLPTFQFAAIALAITALGIILRLTGPWLMGMGGVPAKIASSFWVTDVILMIMAVMWCAAAVYALVINFRRDRRRRNTHRNIAPNAQGRTASDGNAPGAVEDLSPQADDHSLPSQANEDSDRAGEPGPLLNRVKPVQQSLDE